jgi:hypothetical protein
MKRMLGGEAALARETHARKSRRIRRIRKALLTDPPLQRRFPVIVPALRKPISKRNLGMGYLSSPSWIDLCLRHPAPETPRFPPPTRLPGSRNTPAPASWGSAGGSAWG